MPHPDEGLIHAWLDGELDAAEAMRVESLVASDPEWAAAVKEARGLLAASARIVKALDRVPANVIPQPAITRHATRRWVWRAAAVVALMAGSAVVLKRGTPELTAPGQAKAPAQALAEQVATDAAGVLPGPSAAPATVKKSIPTVAPRQADSSAGAVRRLKTEPGFVANAPIPDIRSTMLRKELYKAKSIDSIRAKVTVSALGGARADTMGAGRRAAPTAAAAPPAARATQAQAQAFERVTRLRPSCFLQREPLDSATRIIRLDAVALADSIRLERLTLRGDTLTAVNGRLIAVRVPCPEP